MILPLMAMVFLVASVGHSDSKKAPGNTVQVIDDAIFETKPPAPSSDTVESIGGTKRYRGPEADYTIDQGAEWSQKCSIDNEPGSPPYRDCYKKERRKTMESQRVNRRGVERKLGATEGLKAKEAPSGNKDKRKVDEVFEDLSK